MGGLASVCTTTPNEVSNAAKNGLTVFDFTFEEDTEIGGHMSLRLNGETRLDMHTATLP
ncbi:MAG: hypothetical protein AAF222_04585 [Pseudomonadota bacterium]